MGAGGVALGSDVVSMHSTHHGTFQDMVETNGQHGADHLSLWSTNAKEAAAKITEVTRARQWQKDEKYGKFLRDLHPRVGESSKEKSLSKIPKARNGHCLNLHCQNEIDRNRERSKCDDPAVHDMERHLGPRPVSKMEKVRVYLEKELSKNSKDGHGMSKLHRECMLEAVTSDKKALGPLEENTCYTHHNQKEDKTSSVAKKIDCCQLPKLITKPCLEPLSQTTSAQILDAVNSEPCTPMGWNLLPTSFSALEMRSLESTASPTPPDTREAGSVTLKLSQVLSHKKHLKHLQGKCRGKPVPGRSVSSLSRFCKGERHEMRGKENVRSNTSLGNWIVNGNNKQYNMEEILSNTLSSDSTQNQSQCEVSISSSSPSSEGVTTCPMGVILKGREKYETQGQGKQSFSDVWKCAMEVERRCAHSLHILKEKRLEQQKLEKRHKAELIREKSLAKQREAVQKQLQSVATLKARREATVQRHRALEKKRFLKKGGHEGNPSILDDVEGCEMEGCDTDDLTSTQRLLSVDNSKTWLKLQALHKQLYLNVLAEKNWMRP